MRVLLLRPEWIHSDLQLCGRVPGWYFSGQLQTVRLGSPHKNLSRSFFGLTDRAPHLDSQSESAAGLAGRGFPSPLAAMFLAIFDTGDVEIFERPVLEYQLRVVFLSARSDGNVFRIGEGTPLDTSVRRDWVRGGSRTVPVAGPIRLHPSLLRFLVRALTVCGISGGCAPGQAVSVSGPAKTCRRLGPGAGRGYCADHRRGSVPRARALALGGRIAVCPRDGSSRPRSGIWTRFLRGSPEPALAQSAGDGNLLPLFGPHAGLARPERRLLVLGVGNSFLARCVGCRDCGLRARPGRGAADIRPIRAAVTTAFQEAGDRSPRRAVPEGTCSCGRFPSAFCDSGARRRTPVVGRYKAYAAETQQLDRRVLTACAGRANVSPRFRSSTIMS